VQRKIAVADVEPRGFVERGQRVSHPERLVFESPTAFGVPEAGQRVVHRVEVGADAQAVRGEVVADVGYDGEPARSQGVAQRRCEAGAAEAPGQENYLRL
jgi:hypothetical protein